MIALEIHFPNRLVFAEKIQKVNQIDNDRRCDEQTTDEPNLRTNLAIYTFTKERSVSCLEMEVGDGDILSTH